MQTREQIMSPEAVEVLKLLGSFLAGAAGAVAGAVGAPFIKEWWERKHLRTTEKQVRWRPFLGAAQDFKQGLIDLKAKYQQKPLAAPWDRRPALPTEARDFVELLTLNQDPAPIDKWYDDLKTDPDAVRNDAGAVQRVRVRLHELNCATNSLYKTAKYLGYAQRVRGELEQGRLICPQATRNQLIGLILNVRAELNGTSKDHPGAGVIMELQDSIGESVWSPDDRVISELEFRKSLLQTPGWEQYLELLRFFVALHLKLDSEVAKTITALDDLCPLLERMCT